MEIKVISILDLIIYPNLSLSLQINIWIGLRYLNCFVPVPNQSRRLYVEESAGIMVAFYIFKIEERRLSIVAEKKASVAALSVSVACTPS